MSPPDPDSDDGRAVGFDEQALYVVVRKAVEDAILGAIGTLLLVGIAIFLVWYGAIIALMSISTGATLAGVAMVGFGLYLGATTLKVIPPARHWF